MIQRKPAKLGAIYTNPNFTPQGKPSGYKVRGEVVLRSTRLAELADLAGQLAQRLQLAGIAFQVSRETRQKEEKKLLTEASQAFRAKAQATATAFSFQSYDIKTLAVGNDGLTPMPIQSRGNDMSLRSASAALPTAGGESDLLLTISGTVELK